VSGSPVAIEAVLFDMDGVIVDSRTVIEAAWSEVMTRHTGRTLSAEEIHEHVHGRTGSHTVAALFPEHSPAEHREIWAAVDRIEETAPYAMIPGVRSFIAELNRGGITVGLVTSSWSEKIQHVLGLLNLPEPFSAVVNRDDVANGKPHPEPYLKGCAAVGVPTERVMVFEDSLSGVRSAVAAGTCCIGIGSAQLLEAGAVAAVEEFTKLGLAPLADTEYRLDGINTPILLHGRAGKPSGPGPRG
jgi:HAD superfamily hydrolase (TIGR01509 family)